MGYWSRRRSTAEPATSRMHTVTLLAIVLLCLFVEQNQGLKCYQCQSSEPKCNDPMDKSLTATACGTGLDMCKKEKTKDNKVTRSCFAKAECKEEDKDGKVIKCCSDKDGCNGASALHVSSLVLLPAAALFYLYK